MTVFEADHALEGVEPPDEHLAARGRHNQLHRFSDTTRQRILAGELGQALLGPGEGGESFGAPLELIPHIGVAQGQRTLRGNT